MNITIIIISSFLLVQYSLNSCYDYILNLQTFTCINEEPFYEDSGVEYFRISSSFGEHIMRVEDDSKTIPRDIYSQNLLRESSGVLQYQVTLYDQNHVKKIDVFENCIETLTLESTLLKHHYYFGEERNLLSFFVQLLATVSNIHDRDIVLINLKMDNVFISEMGTPLIQDLSGPIEKYKEREVDQQFNEYMSLKEFEDKKNNKLHSYNGWEDYFAVGVMLYHAIYRKFPFDLAAINTISQYRNFEIEYGSEADLLSQELMKALLGKFSGDYQIKDIRKFVKDFDHIEDRYFDIPVNVVTQIGMTNFMAGVLSKNFVDREIEKNPSLKEFIDKHAMKNQEILDESVLHLLQILKLIIQHIIIFLMMCNRIRERKTQLVIRGLST